MDPELLFAAVDAADVRIVEWLLTQTSGTHHPGDRYVNRWRGAAPWTGAI